MQVTRRQSIAFLSAAAVAPALPAFAQVANPPFQLPEHLRPVNVRVKRQYAPGQLVVDTASHYLYHVTAVGQALRYGVAVGKEGLNFSGQAVIGRKAEWPSWTPTPEMIERTPSYAQFSDGMPGGPNNPLGARALYLYVNGRDTAFRIHGTNAPRSIGHSVSNGCIRMLNEHVMTLYQQIPIGTRVTVL
jgi:lipoprotein-anchoring transpeptidase ErfK/SrfK